LGSTAAATLLLDRAKHVGQITRVITCVRHYLRAKNVGLRFVIAAVTRLHDLSAKHTDLRAALSAEDRTSKDHTERTQSVPDAALLCRLSRRMTKRDGAHPVVYHPGHFAFVLCRLDHPAVHKHRAARKCEGID